MELINKEVASDYWDKETHITDIITPDGKSAIHVTVGEKAQDDEVRKFIGIRNLLIKDGNMIFTRKGLNVQIATIDDLIEALEFIRDNIEH